jgi:hypothetical protein
MDARRSLGWTIPVTALLGFALSAEPAQAQG